MSIQRRRALHFSPAEDVRGAVVAFIRSARRSVNVNAYGIADAQVVDALIDRHVSGCVVSVVCDHTQASGPADKVALQRLVDAGIELVITTSPTGAIDHEKVVIVDVVAGALANESEAWWGSYNLSASAEQQRNYGEQDNDPAVVARFWSDWQASHDWGIAHHPEWQIAKAATALVIAALAFGPFALWAAIGIAKGIGA